MTDKEYFMNRALKRNGKRMFRNYTLKDKRLPEGLRVFHRAFDGMYVVVEDNKIVKRETPRGPHYAYDGVTKEDAIQNYFKIFQCEDCIHMLEWLLTDKANDTCRGTIAFKCIYYKKRESYALDKKV